MRKKIISVISVLLSAILLNVCILIGCSGGNEGGEYVIQYSYGTETYQLKVTSGMPYALDVIPEKVGYSFEGLFDKDEGGNQYISANGSSLAPFRGNKNIVLFPHFSAKQYTVILDYQQAEVTGSRQLAVSYDESLPELPKNLTREHKEFTGWYTAENCGGTQIADKYGLIPIVSVVNDKNFDVSGEYITLYAGFETEKITVTCAFNFETNAEKIQVDYGTPVSEIVTKTRINGEAPLTWSKTQGGEVFNGNVEEEMTLYACEFAPVIDFDSNGGSEVNSVIARAGSVVALPTPKKDLAKFSHWEDMQGNGYNETSMPNKSITLRAVWQAKLVFDENGGSEVNDISVAAGESIILPTPEKDGFIFAGWYTADKEQYSSTKMPTVGLALKAGWYKEKTEKVIIISNTYKFKNYLNNNEVLTEKLYIDLSQILPNDFYGYIKISAYMNLEIAVSGYSLLLSYYSQESTSSAYRLHTQKFAANSTNFREYEFSMAFMLQGNKIYCSRKFTTNHDWLTIRDYYLNVTYSDTTNLYL